MQSDELLEFLVSQGDLSTERKTELEILLGERVITRNSQTNGDASNNAGEAKKIVSAATSYQSNIPPKKEEKLKMYYGVSREDFTPFSADKKRMKLKDFKEGRRREANAPQPDRIPLPSLPESVKQEYRASIRDMQQKKHRISVDSPPTVCLYTVLNANSGLCSASIADDGSMFALGFGNSTIQVNALAAEHMKLLKKPSELEKLDNEMEDYSTEIYDEQNQPKSLTFVGHSGPVHSVSFSCEKRLLLSGSRDSTIRLWNLEMSRNLVIYRPMTPVWQVQFCSRGYYFASSNADKTVSLWTTDRIKPLRIFADSQDDVTCIDFHPNCNYISGGSEDNIIRVWDVLTGSCVRTFTGHKGPIRGLKTSPCGRYLISASEDGSIAVWDLGQQKLLGVQEESEPFEYNSPIVFSRDGTVIVTSTPKFGLSFFSLDSIISNQAPPPLINPSGFSLFSYPTKRTSILDFIFTRKNVVVGIGAFEQ